MIRLRADGRAITRGLLEAGRAVARFRRAMPFAPKVPTLKPVHRAPPKASSSARGYGSEHRRQRERLLQLHPLCQRCQERWATDLHHIDRNPRNRAESNILMLCEPCHHGIEHARR